jgi:hypothetical protein
MIKTKITANYATYGNPARLKALKQSIESIVNQVDIVRVRYNGSIHDRHLFEGIERMPKVEFYCGEDLTDLGKFFGLSFLKDEYFFTCDDKIIFPPDYVKRTISLIDRHRCIVTYHGRILRNDSSYYKGNHTLFDYRRQQTVEQPVDVPGTGVMAFRTDYFCPVEILDSPYMKMVDLVFALQARKEKKRIICLKRAAGWIRSINMKGIWHEFNEGPRKKPETEQIRLMKQILNYEK